MAKEVQMRIHAAKRAWGTFKGCWYDPRIPLKIRRLLYQAVVRSTFITGLIAACLTAGQLKQLEAQQMRCARSLLQGEGRGLTNNQVRQRLKLPTLASWLRTQRLHWLQVIMADPPTHAVVLAPLAGSTVWDETAQLNQLGIPLATANPWLRLFWQDVEHLAQTTAPLRDELQGLGWLALPTS